MSPSVPVRLLLSQSDERLVGYARAGHERAFEALVQRYRRQLLAYCRRLLLSEQSAEDALQQALLQAWVALSNGAEVSAPRAWLYRVVHNAAVQSLRVSRYDYCQLSESLSGADAPQADLDRRIAVREALAGLAALPEMQRRALLHTAVEGRTHQQAAADLGLSEPALRGLVYRARASLRAATSAIVPPPLIAWALDAGTRGTPVLERVAGLGAAGGGSAGLAGLLAKGSAVAVTAGALAGGIVASHAPHTNIRHPQRARASPATKPSTAASSTRPVAFTHPDRNAVPHSGSAKDSPLPSPRELRPIPALREQPAPTSAHRKDTTDDHSTPIFPSSSPPAGHLRHDDGKSEANGGGPGGQDGGGGDSQREAAPSGHDETRGESSGSGESKRGSSGDSGEQSGSGLSGSGSKDGSTGEGSSEWQSLDGASWSGSKDQTPTSESSQQK